jgi:KDO2-lipid IV(A) lauroyltransferase
MRALGAVFYFFAQILGWCMRLTPLFVQNIIASAGAFLWFDIIGFRRRVILLNLAHAFPRQSQESSSDFMRRIHALARLNVKNYFLGFFEVLEKTTWSQKKLEEKIVMHGVQHVQEATKNGEGAFLVSAHIGNWEATLALANQVGKPLSCIVRHVRNSFWDEALKRSRKKFDINLLPESSSGISALRLFKKGELVVFVMDQHTGEPHGVLAKFFGLRAWTGKGLAILSGRLNAKILPVHSYREGGKIHVVIEPPLKMDDLGDCKQEAQILEHVQRVNNKIEEWVREVPEQYFWVHRRFKAEIDYKNEKLPFP